MSTTFTRYTVTAALPYANGPKHIGHLAGAYIPSDVYVRYLRLTGKDVIFVCGSDEHGTAIPNQALKENTTSKAIIDKYDALIRDCFNKLGMSFDIYHRTSEPIHHQTSQEFFLALYNKGLLTEEVSEQYFDTEANVFLADRYIVGTCPRCGNTNAYGDQCENCGSTLSPRELINPRSTLSGKTPVLRETKHWYLPLERYEPWLRDWILKSHQQDWKPNVYGQCKSWIEAGLQPRAMTRDLDWGIKVPLPDAEGKVLYVWFDAPVGYISATRALFEEVTSGNLKFATPRSDLSKAKKEDWKKYWQAEDTRLIHFIGKDNIVFHCIIFPVMLHTSGEFIVPDNVPANEFMNLEGDKMSTSRGWSIEMHEYLDDFPDKPDVLRYALLTNLPEAKDSEFTWKDFQAKNNNELVAILGNFVNRAVVLTQKYFDNKVPSQKVLTEVDKKALEELELYPSKIASSIEAFRFREATANLMDLARVGNKYLAETEPWKLAKTDMDRVGTILNIALQIAASLAIVTEPFLPFTSRKLKNMLGVSDLAWSDAGNGALLKAGAALNEAPLLFEKIEDERIEIQIKKLIDKKRAVEVAQQPAEPAKAEISFDDFSKMDIRIGKILKAERVEKSKKLLKLQVDTGIDVRTVMSGIAEHFAPEVVIGKQVTILVNLAPRKIMGVESQGMILMAADKDGSLKMLSPSGEVVPGSQVS
ncbi:MAG TPA: methionine--tRNA ligase [Cyclobacteriaceae bacterium]|jgi:methionyl-tRNA synthetase|nr:methionine--tRNA ligase [Cytophagales bacterium]HRE66342.1 methionine--tRNA ligase [Cyclobacteriaceae bacterium]HRF32836.1 methionine--tRNA ligase [Cyclobacteriaceae bacterium]